MTVEFSPTSAGQRRYLFEISPLEGEVSPRNNLRETLIEIVEESPRILHLEGEPRWEYGKLRASLARNEKQLRLVSVLRSAEGKYYRQGVTSGEELTEGFPRTDEELFGYAGLVIGSIEANFFRYEQLRWIEQFAARRGGGVLLLGGGRAFRAAPRRRRPAAPPAPPLSRGRIRRDADRGAAPADALHIERGEGAGAADGVSGGLDRAGSASSGDAAQ
jgi:hypothetical protein